jgi:CheY-like chemotaxis protein
MGITGETMTKVLIIEDNETLNEAYKLILEKDGHEVTTAFNGEEGLEKLKDVSPDLILLDMLMPKMDGLEFLRHFNPSNFPKTTIIILSNLNEDEQVEEARKLGAHRYILKANTSPRELAIKVNHIIGRV